MLTLDLRNELKGLEEQLKQLSAKNIKFAATKALSRTAVEFRDLLRSQAPSELTIRNGYALKTINATTAKLSDSNPTAAIGSTSDFMKSLVFGAEKKPQNGSGMVAVPIGARPSKMATTPRGQWPGRLLSKYNAYQKLGENRADRYAKTAGVPYDYFVGPLSRGLKPNNGGPLAVYKITDKSGQVTFGPNGPHRAHSQNLKLAYVLEKSVPIPEGKWSFLKSCDSDLPKIWSKNTRKALQEELTDKGFV